MKPEKAIKERDRDIDAICKLLWQRDYPNGGSAYWIAPRKGFDSPKEATDWIKSITGADNGKDKNLHR